MNEPHKCKNSDFIIANTSNWVKPKADDPCWGWKCRVCGGVIATGFTIMTSNLDMVEIAEKYGGRVSDRIREMFNIILMLGDSYRS